MEGGPIGRQGKRMKEKENGYRRSVAGKVVVAGIVEKANPKKGGGDRWEKEDILKKLMRRKRRTGEDTERRKL